MDSSKDDQRKKRDSNEKKFFLTIVVGWMTKIAKNSLSWTHDMTN